MPAPPPRDLVSVIMPSHNSAEFIAETIDSVVAQTYREWELIIVDDRSSDGTLEIVRDYAARDDRIRSIALEKNGGAAVARNTAIEAAQGRWIAFLDSDDIWTPDKLEKQIGMMEATGCPFSYASYDRISEAGEFISTVRVPARVRYNQLLKNNVIACLTAVYDSKELGKVMMPLIRKGQDYGLWLTILQRVEYATGMPEILGRYRLREGSISSNKFESAIWVWRLYRDVKKLNIFVASYYFSFYIATGLLRRICERLFRRN